MLCTCAGVLLSCWQRNCRQVTSSDRASRAMMASLIDTLCCRTHIPACSAVGVASPSLLELQLLPAKKRQDLCSKFIALVWDMQRMKFNWIILNSCLMSLTNQDLAITGTAYYLEYLYCWLWCERPEAEGSSGSLWLAVGCQPDPIVLRQLPRWAAWNRPP